MPWKTGKALSIGSRKEQQDRVGIFSSDDGQRHLIALADGMGGHRDGAQAAQRVIDAARSRFNGRPPADPQSFLYDLCGAAHAAIRTLGAKETLSPGSTCVYLYLSGPEAYWAHVGDSRLYHFRNGRLLNRTTDHSVLQLMLARGQVDEHSEAADSLQNQLYNRLGGLEEPAPDFGASAVEAGDLFVLCSDGFWQGVEADQTRDSIVASGVTDEGAERLVELARRQNGARSDNISLALAQWEPQSRRRSGLASLFERLRSFH